MTQLIPIFDAIKKAAPDNNSYRAVKNILQEWAENWIGVTRAYLCFDDKDELYEFSAENFPDIIHKEHIVMDDYSGLKKSLREYIKILEFSYSPDSNRCQLIEQKIFNQLVLKHDNTISSSNQQAIPMHHQTLTTIEENPRGTEGTVSVSALTENSTVPVRNYTGSISQSHQYHIQSERREENDRNENTNN